MDARPRFARPILAMFVVLGMLAIVATASAQAPRAHAIATAAATKRVEAHAAALDRRGRHLRAVAKRACATHPHSRRCRESRALLDRVLAQAARLRKDAGHAHKPTGSKLTQSAGSSGSTGAGSAGAGSTSTSPSKSNPLAGPPAPTSPVSPPPSSPSAGSAALTFQPGVDSGMEADDLAGSALLGAKLVRIEWPIDTPATQMQTTIAAYAAKGIRVLALASFYGKLPSAAEAQALAGWAKAYGPHGTFWAGRTEVAIQSIEFGNETSYGYQYGDSAGETSYQERAGNYALRFKEAAEAIAATGTGVGLLAEADDWTGDWVNGMYAAVPDLSRYVAGWVIHPYGSSWRVRLQDLIAQTAANGAPSTIPVDITEWGVSTDNGACLDENAPNYNRCMSYEEAASTLNNVSGEIEQLLGSRLGDFILYQVRDQKPTATTTDSEMYFGALQHELQSKGAYTTAVKTLLASS
jgi:hypothetical protein